MSNFRIAVIPGDGIGPEIIEQSLAVIDTLNRKFGSGIEITKFPYGADYYLETGVTIPSEFIDELDKNYNAILMGTFGDPRIPDMIHAKKIINELRTKLDLYANIQPVKLLDEWLSPLKNIEKNDVDFYLFRETIEGFYIKSGGTLQKDTNEAIAVQNSINTYKGIERFISTAFEFAEKEQKKNICLIEKSNIFTHTHKLWIQVFNAVAKKYPEITARKQIIDSAIVQIIKNPSKYDILITCNLFGDILSDLCAYLQGGAGLSFICNINPDRMAIFAPLQSSSPKHAGHNTANPLGVIIATQYMLNYLNLNEEAAAVEKAIFSSISSHWTTIDLGGIIGTKEVGDHIISNILEQ